MGLIYPLLKIFSHMYLLFAFALAVMVVIIMSIIDSDNSKHSLWLIAIKILMVEKWLRKSMLR